MQKRKLAGVILIFLSFNSYCFTTLPNVNFLSDSIPKVSGQNIFTQNCSACHNFKQDGIGPQLSGLTAAVSDSWIKKFIKDPKKVIDSGDKRARKLFEKYHTVMPSYNHLSDAEIKSIIAFLHTQKKPAKKSQAPAEDPNALKDPVPERIVLSDLVVGLEEVTQIPFSSDQLPRTRITKLDVQPGKENLFILDLRGKLYMLHDSIPTVYMDIDTLRPKFVHQPGLATGFGSFAFHPDFVQNGLLYTTHTEPAGSAHPDFGYADSIKVTLQWVLTEWKTDHPDSAVFSGEGRELFRVNVVSGIHGVQEITFNSLARPGDEDYGLLYIGVGDGGSVENGYPFLAHTTERIWGTILRIDPRGNNSRNRNYGIPPGNPFNSGDSSKTVKEIYAMGFRNPHRITWSKSGQMLAVNIGHANIESINLITPGADYGWPIREGTFLLNPSVNMNRIYPLPPNDSSYNITYPVAQYDHDEGKAITGGFEYLGTAIPQLEGKYLFGDIPLGRLFYIELADIKQGSQAPIKEWKVSLKGITRSLKELCGTDRVDLHFGRDSKGELYILTKPDGKIYRLVNAR